MRFPVAKSMETICDVARAESPKTRASQVLSTGISEMICFESADHFGDLEQIPDPVMRRSSEPSGRTT